MNTKYNKIIHIDMDAFFASVEQRNIPELKGKPVIVGGDPKGRGVVAACSYEARKYGIHSAMASSRAYKLCPDAIFVRGNFEEYKSVSNVIREIFYEYTDIVEPLSLDEAYLDVTINKKNLSIATIIAQEIRKKIYETTELTASAGVSFNKFLAKSASDFNKPNGITVITPLQADDFINRLPIGKFYGIGKVTEKKMIKLGIKTGYDLKKLSREDLIRLFGKVGGYYFDIANNLDNRPVSPARIRKSIGKEITLKKDIDDRSEMIKILESVAYKVIDILESHNTKGKTITLKIKYFDFVNITRSITIQEAVDDFEIIMMHVRALLKKTEAGIKKVRLLGISISNLNNEKSEIDDKQLVLPFL